MGLVVNRFGIDASVRKNLPRSARAAFCVALLLGILCGADLAHGQVSAAAPAAQPDQSASESVASKQAASLETIVVSGSRIVRDGYSSPTPVSVIGAGVIQTNATSNVADALNTLPNFAGSATPQSTAVTVTSGQQAINGLNIGGLGATRTLVLVNGQRTVGSVLTGVVDVSELPQQVISRVDL